MLDFFCATFKISYDSKISHFVYFRPPRTGLISIQLFSVYHVHMQCLILINE